MRRICAWCKKDMVRKEGDEDNDIITHGICAECEKLVEFENVKTRKKLNKLDKPILLITEDAFCIMANTAAMEALEKELSSIEGFLCGNVIGCMHATQPGGCGKTESCPKCVIRNTVKDTFETSKSHLKVEAYQDIETPEGIRKTRFLVSTEKRGNRVLLRID